MHTVSHMEEVLENNYADFQRMMPEIKKNGSLDTSDITNY